MNRTFASLLAAVLSLAALVSCSKPPTVEQQIIAAIREMEANVEAGESRAFMRHLADGFSAQKGSVNRDQARALLIMQLNRYKRLQAQLFPIRVASQSDDAATADFQALVTGGPGWIPEHGRVYEFHTVWRLLDGDWLMVSANWKPLDVEDVL